MSPQPIVAHVGATPAGRTSIWILEISSWWTLQANTKAVNTVTSSPAEVVRSDMLEEVRLPKKG